MAKKPQRTIDKAFAVQLVARHPDLHTAEQILAALQDAVVVIDEMLHRRNLAREALDWDFTAAADGEIVAKDDLPEESR